MPIKISIPSGFFLSSLSVNAATLVILGRQLDGAFDVNVGGTLYEATFVDGTCLALFSGCEDTATDFDFQTQASANLAALALLDQALIDGPDGNFDTSPELTFGTPGGNYLAQVFIYLMRSQPVVCRHCGESLKCGKSLWLLDCLDYEYNIVFFTLLIIPKGR